MRQEAEVRVDGEVEGSQGREALRRLGGPHGEVEDAELPLEEDRGQQGREGRQRAEENGCRRAPSPRGESGRGPQERDEQDERRVLERGEGRGENGGRASSPRGQDEGQRDEGEGEDLGVRPHQEAEGGREEQQAAQREAARARPGKERDGDEREAEQDRVRDRQRPQRREAPGLQQASGGHARERVAPEVVAVEPLVAPGVVVRHDAALVDREALAGEEHAQRLAILRLQLRRAVSVPGLQHQQVLAGVPVRPQRQA